MRKIGIAGMSDGLAPEKREQIQRLQTYLKNCDLESRQTAYIFEDERSYPGNGKLRAAELMKLYQDPEITDIFDVSGGNQANEVLADLDYEVIRNSDTTFWGYSDLSTIVNAIYTKTGKISMLYQGKFLVGDRQELQQSRFESYLKCRREQGDFSKDKESALSKTELTDLSVTCIQGGPMEGILVGGNIRCFLKLAGTEYFPDLTDKILLLEAWSGQLPQILTYLNQYKQLGAFSKVRGILLGTFTEYEMNQLKPDVTELVKDLAGPDMPIYTTREVGHGHDSKAVRIGGYYRF